MNKTRSFREIKFKDRPKQWGKNGRGIEWETRGELSGRNVGNISGRYIVIKIKEEHF